VSQGIVILSFGTRGDVHPLIALAMGLGSAGYRVVLGADNEFEPDIRARGLSYAPLTMNFRQFFGTPDGRAAMSEAKAPKDFSFDRTLRPMFDQCWEAAQGADLIVYDTMLPIGRLIAQRLGVPALMTSVVPNATPTGAFPMIGAPRIGSGAWFNRASYGWWRFSTMMMYPKFLS